VAPSSAPTPQSRKDRPGDPGLHQVLSRRHPCGRPREPEEDEQVRRGERAGEAVVEQEAGHARADTPSQPSGLRIAGSLRPRNTAPVELPAKVRKRKKATQPSSPRVSRKMLWATSGVSRTSGGA